MHPHTAAMRVNVDWSDFLDKETPSGMTVIMYPQSGELSEPVFTRSNTISHAIVNLPEGRYNSVVFNQSESEFGTLGFRNMGKFSTAEVVTVEAAAKWYSTKGENERIAVFCAAIVCPMVNTGIFLLGCQFFFLETVAGWGAAMGYENVTSYMFLGLAGINFIIELGVNIVLAPVIVRLIKLGIK